MKYIIAMGLLSGYFLWNEPENVTGSQLLGIWLAEWEYLDSDEGNSAGNQMRKLIGEINFKQGKAKIIAYGHNDCLLAKDTIVHHSKWNITGGNILFGNKNSPDLLNYKIRKFDKNQIECWLGSDIRLILTRKN